MAIFAAALQTRFLPRLFYKASAISTSVTVIVFLNCILFAQMDYTGLRLHNNVILTFGIKRYKISVYFNKIYFLFTISELILCIYYTNVILSSKMHYFRNESSSIYQVRQH
jgi:hypothetical protein